MCKQTISFETYDDDDNEVVIELPAKYKVCGRCAGAGSHVNPNVDGHGISQEEFDEDPDFRESYFNGDYDVQCEECEGQRVVLTVDRERTNPTLLQMWDDKVQSDYECAMEYAHEQRMGY